MIDLARTELVDAGEDRDARVAALGRFLDWAEREAADLQAADCGMCLQLARVALLSGRRMN